MVRRLTAGASRIRTCGPTRGLSSFSFDKSAHHPFYRCRRQLPKTSVRHAFPYDADQGLTACARAGQPLTMPGWSATIFAAASRKASALALAAGARCTTGTAAATAGTSCGSGRSRRGAVRVSASDNRDNEGCRAATSGEYSPPAYLSARSCRTDV